MEAGTLGIFTTQLMLALVPPQCHSDSCEEVGALGPLHIRTTGPRLAPQLGPEAQDPLMATWGTLTRVMAPGF